SRWKLHRDTVLPALFCGARSRQTLSCSFDTQHHSDINMRHHGWTLAGCCDDVLPMDCGAIVMKEGGDNEGSNNEGSNNEGGEHGPNAPGLDHLVDASDRDVRLGLGLGFGIIDIDGDAKVHTPKHLTRIVLDKDVDAINRERPVDECCLGELLRFYWTLE